MKILLVNATFYPDLNGTITYIYNIARALKKNHNVTLICGSRKPVKSYNGIRTIMFRKPSSKHSLEEKYKLYKKRFKKTLASLADYDLIISKTDLFLEELKEKFPTKKIIFVSPGLSDIYNSKLQAYKKVRRKEISRAIENIRIITLSKNLRNQFVKQFNSQHIKVIPPGVSRSKIHKKTNDIIFVARLSSEKNPTSALKALHLSKKGNLNILGSGPELKNIKNIIKKYKLEKRVKIIGFKKNTEKYYSNSKIFLFTSKYDSFGLVLLEAMSNGLVCIAFKPDGKRIITASNEIIKHGKTGFLVNSEEEIAEKINLLLNDKKLYQKISRNAFNESKRYSWKKHAEEILSYAKTT